MVIALPSHTGREEKGIGVDVSDETQYDYTTILDVCFFIGTVNFVWAWLLKVSYFLDKTFVIYFYFFRLQMSSGR